MKYKWTIKYNFNSVHSQKKNIWATLKFGGLVFGAMINQYMGVGVVPSILSRWYIIPKPEFVGAFGPDTFPYLFTTTKSAHKEPGAIIQRPHGAPGQDLDLEKCKKTSHPTPT